MANLFMCLADRFGSRYGWSIRQRTGIGIGLGYIGDSHGSRAALEFLSLHTSLDVKSIYSTGVLFFLEPFEKSS